jgi:hypothetical protein
VNVTGSTVTAGNANAGQVVDGSVMNITDSELTGGTNGIRISDDDHTLGPDTLIVSGSTLTNQAGNNGEAAIRVDGAEAKITLNNSKVISGTGAGVTQHTVLNVTSIDRAGNPFGSLVNLTANSSTLNGDILSDAASTTNVHLEHKSILRGAVNENQLTGATGINPTEQVTHLPSPGLPPQTVNLSIDSTSTWTMRASSTLNTLTVNPQAHINFPHPPAGPFKTLLMNNLIGTGGIFGMNVDLGLIKGDLIEILTKSEGEHLLTFVNRNQGSDLPVNTALLVVRTPDGGAGFTGEADGGTFKYFVAHGDGSSVTPIKNDWYLVRGDEITPPQTTPPPPTNPTPPEFAPGDNLPLPPEIPAVPLSPAADLTNTANAAIGTYSSSIPLFYADMQTLVERMGELRLGIETALAPVPPTPPEVGKGVVESKQIAAPPAPPRSEWGVWIRGFGNGMRITMLAAPLTKTLVVSRSEPISALVRYGVVMSTLVYSAVIFMLRVISGTEVTAQPTHLASAAMRRGSTRKGGTPIWSSNTRKCGTILTPRPRGKLFPTRQVTTTFQQLVVHLKSANALILPIAAFLSNLKLNWQASGKTA